MKHELFKIEADYNKREEEYYTENASQYLNNYLEDALIKAFENYKKEHSNYWNIYRKYLRKEDTHKDDNYKESILSFSLNRYVTEDHKNDWEDL